MHILRTALVSIESHLPLLKTICPRLPGHVADMTDQTRYRFRIRIRKYLFDHNTCIQCFIMKVMNIEVKDYFCEGRSKTAIMKATFIFISENST